MPNARPIPDSSPGDGTRERLLLARKLAYLLLSKVFLALPQPELEQELLAVFDTVCAAVAGEPFSAQPSHEAGTRLVELGCSSDEALSCTVEVLSKGLLSWPAFQPVHRFAERIALALTALACGFAEAARRAEHEQQESMNLALLKAVRDARWSLRASEARFDEVAMLSASGIMITDLDGRLSRVNAAVSRILGYSAAELAGVLLFDLIPEDGSALLREDYQALLAGTKDRIRQPQRLTCKNGDIARISLTASLLRSADDQSSHFVIVVEDGTELLLLRNELVRQTLHDPLTGLPNRQFFTTQVENALRRADPVYGVTVFHLRLDAFATTYTGLGQRAGEAVLVEVGRRLKAVVADERAMVARFDGHEFGILVENSATTHGVATTVTDINRELAKPIRHEGHGMAVSASIGVAHSPEHHWDSAELLRAADVTLRRATAAGRGQWQRFDPDVDAHNRRRSALAADMPGAWQAGEVGVIYRPTVDLADGRIIGVEPLLRWQRPGCAAPLGHHECVELAEGTGLTLPLGAWLLGRAGRDSRWWRRRYTNDVPLVVGLTPHQSTNADLVSRVIRVLEDTALPPADLTLWFPVRSVSTPRVADNLRRLADIGVRVGLDDFGAGADELALVTDLPVRSVRLVRQLAERRAGATADSPFVGALATLVQLVHRVGATVTVDGLHARWEADWWRAAGADAGTGTGELFGAGYEPDEMATLLAM